MMNNRDLEKAQRLQAEVRKPAPLSFKEAQDRLPELVMAELAGEDVDTAFADVFLTFNHYPELADQYELLLEEMRSDLADPTPVAPLATSSQILPGKQQATPGIILRRLGEQLRGFLVQLMPKPLPEPLTGHLSDESLEYISEWVPDQLVQLTVELQPLDADSWELVVMLLPASDTAWHVVATLDGVELPVIAQDEYETRFGPLDAVPTERITLVCRPDT
ncbi:MAG: hypothetical protein JOZ51_19340 [Chloroflexi bacterium]|nr:hypothetical protein [Chloroflexota bacterium]